MDEGCSMHARNEKCIKYYDWKTSSKRTLRRPRCRWEDNIRIYLKEIRWEGVDWMNNFDQDRDQWWTLVNMVMNLQGIS
jgi:hypothetical protein